MLSVSKRVVIMDEIHKCTPHGLAGLAKAKMGSAVLVVTSTLLPLGPVVR